MQNNTISPPLDRNIKLTIEYDGTFFCGWQSQPEARTVQGTIEPQLQLILKHPVRLTVAGRTDAGVHAHGQVANFHTVRSIPVEAIKKGLNSLLPPDIIILHAEQVPVDFHSRFSAKWRSYRYIITKTPKAIGQMYAWYYPGKLDLAKMQAASKFLIGELDFKSFCQAGAEVDHYLSNVASITWQETDNQIIMDIKANRFLQHMVRIILGTLIEIGRGKLAPAAASEIILARDRTKAGPTVPAHGLFLLRVEY